MRIRYGISCSLCQTFPYEYPHGNWCSWKIELLQIAEMVSRFLFPSYGILCMLPADAYQSGDNGFRNGQNMVQV
jgi:hypothetical protein